MNKYAKPIISFLLLAGLSCPLFSFAQAPEADQSAQVLEDHFAARVTLIISEEEIIREDGSAFVAQKLKLIGLEGEYKDQEIFFDGSKYDVRASQQYKVGDKVMVNVGQDVDGELVYFITDYVRRAPLYILGVIFALVIVLTGKWRGLKALIGLVISFLVIVEVILPLILKGYNPLLISVVFSLVIVLATTYLIYGLNKKSSISIAGTVVGIFLVGILAVLFTKVAHLAGFAQEESLYLIGLTGGQINLQGLLLAGIMIGALGVLDDITISQVSVVQELKEANPDLPQREIYKRAMKVGVDHIASMVNTLFLAYAGAALPLLLLFTIGQEPSLSFGEAINLEIISTEVVRTFIGSIGLALAVPITTILAAYFYHKKRPRKADAK